MNQKKFEQKKALHRRAFFIWRPQGVSNPRYNRERVVS